MNPLAIYLTSHGHGHAARGCDLIRALFRRAPDLRILVVTTADPAFLRARLDGIPFTLRRASFDAGLVQIDSIRGSAAATLQPALDIVRTRAERVAREIRFLRRRRVAGVVCDLPSLPFEAAAELGIPGIGIGNFTWDWIYQAYARRDPRWRPVVRMYREGYARADLLLRLPLHEPMRSFRRIRDVPLFARPGRNRRAELADRYRRPPHARWVLAAFSSLGWTPAALRRVSALKACSFWTVRPLEWDAPGFTAVDRTEFPFSDMLASCDVVLTKPGFGILSECIVNDKPVVYARRRGFAEAAVLESGIRRHLRHAPLSPADLYAGRVGPALRAALRAPPAPESLPAGGDDIAARMILEAVAAKRPNPPASR